LRAERARQLLALVVPRAREREDAPPLVAGNLGDDVRRGSEAVEPEPLAVARQPQRAVADQPGAEQRRELQRRLVVRQPEAVARVGDRGLRVAAVQVVAREAGAQAEVLAAAVAGASGTHSWAPNVAAAERYALHRHGTIAFAVRTPTRS